tara:strand:- start:270 stop:1013 length:744 start_codon:yes stop_codon:yes gene_type:complete
MSKNIYKKDAVFVVSKNSMYLKIAALFTSAIIVAFIFTLLGNKYIIYNSKDVHSKNIELNKVISEIKSTIKERNQSIKDLEVSYEEISSIFNKYTDVVKFEVASAEKIKSDLFEKDEKILELNRQINYYKFLSNSSNKNNMISIENFNIKKILSANSLSYNFLLLSNISDKNINASYEIYYDGVDLSSNKLIKYHNVNIKKNRVTFKNYLKLSGNITLAKNQNIKALYLVVKYQGKTYKYEHTVVES